MSAKKLIDKPWCLYDILSKEKLSEHVKRICRSNIRKSRIICLVCPFREYVLRVMREKGWKLPASAKMVLHHDDPPCTARLDNGFCPECKLTPDMQSTCFYFYCPLCDVPLRKLKCPKCGQVFMRPNP